MESGKLNKKIRIQEFTLSQDSSGGGARTWTNLTETWAAVEPMQGRELVFAQQINSRISVKITLRYVAGVTPQCRVYDIQMELQCEYPDINSIQGSVDTPAVTSPADGAIDVPVLKVFTCSAFTVTGGTDTHISTQWQIAAADDTSFNTPVYDAASGTELLSLQIPGGKLIEGTDYIIRVRQNGKNLGGSAWSPVVSFTTFAEEEG